jgi:DNA-binding transcriptional ArsR family regulator
MGWLGASLFEQGPGLGLTNISLQRYVCIVCEPPVELVLDVTAVRALAHPLRLRLLDLLRFDGPATATMLAGRVEESSGSTSYHLRQLARHGFIEEVAKRDGGRERWWAYQERRAAVAADASNSVRTLLGELLSCTDSGLCRRLSVISAPSFVHRRRGRLGSLLL